MHLAAIVIGVLLLAYAVVVASLALFWPESHSKYIAAHRAGVTPGEMGKTASLELQTAVAGRRSYKGVTLKADKITFKGPMPKGTYHLHADKIVLLMEVAVSGTNYLVRAPGSTTVQTIPQPSVDGGLEGGTIIEGFMTVVVGDGTSPSTVSDVLVRGNIPNSLGTAYKTVHVMDESWRSLSIDVLATGTITFDVTWARLVLHQGWWLPKGVLAATATVAASSTPLTLTERHCRVPGILQLPSVVT